MKSFTAEELMDLFHITKMDYQYSGNPSPYMTEDGIYIMNEGTTTFASKKIYEKDDNGEITVTIVTIRLKYANIYHEKPECESIEVKKYSSNETGYVNRSEVLSSYTMDKTGETFYARDDINFDNEYEEHRDGTYKSKLENCTKFSDGSFCYEENGLIIYSDDEKKYRFSDLIERYNESYDGTTLTCYPDDEKIIEENRLEFIKRIVGVELEHITTEQFQELIEKKIRPMYLKKAMNKYSQFLDRDEKTHFAKYKPTREKIVEMVNGNIGYNLSRR